MNKRAIAILGGIFILIVGTLGFLIYKRSTNDNDTQNNQVTEQPAQNVEQPTEEPVTEQPTEEPAASGKAVRLTDDEVLSPVLFFQGNGVTHFNSQGQLFRTDLTISENSALLSNKRELTIALKSGITKILWPQNGNNYIAEFDTGARKYWSFYNSDTGVYADLPSEVRAVDWMPSGDRVLLIWVGKNGKATLNTANPDMSGYQTLTEMYEPDDAISISPDGKSILFWRTENRDGKNVISYLSADGKNYRSIVTDGYNMYVKWAPDSNKFVFGKRDAQSQGYGLWLGSLTGELRNLNINTIPDKVTWSKDSRIIYAGVPKTGIAGSGLTQDMIAKIDVTNGSKTDIDPGIAVDAGDMFLSSTEDYLFFKNFQDRALYYIKTAQ